VQGPLAAADGAAEQDEAIADEPVHERCMLIPGVLVTDLPRRSQPRPWTIVSAKQAMA